MVLIMWVRDKNGELVKLDRTEYPSDKLFYNKLMHIIHNKSFTSSRRVIDDIRGLICNVDHAIEHEKR